VAVAALLSTALAAGCFELDGETRRVRERPVIHANAVAQRIDFLSVLTDYQMGNIEAAGKLGGPSKGPVRDGTEAGPLEAGWHGQTSLHAP